MMHLSRQPAVVAGPVRFCNDLSRRELFNAAFVHCGKCIANNHPADFPVRRDFGQWHQHKSALEKARVGQCQIGIVKRHIVVGEEIDVDGARTPSPLLACGRDLALARILGRAPAARGGLAK